MRIVIVSSGRHSPAPCFQKLAKKSNYLIAADGGANHCFQSGMLPDLIVGDFDSISDEAKEFFQSKSEFKVFPKDKDQTDFEIAVMEAEAKGAISRLDLFCWADERIDYMFDHLLALKEKPYSVFMHGESFFCRIMNIHQNKINLEQFHGGTKISIYPIESIPKLKTNGLKWNLDETHLGVSQSNQVLHSDRAQIELIEGHAFVLIESQKPET